MFQVVTTFVMMFLTFTILQRVYDLCRVCWSWDGIELPELVKGGESFTKEWEFLFQGPTSGDFFFLKTEGALGPDVIHITIPRAVIYRGKIVTKCVLDIPECEKFTETIPIPGFGNVFFQFRSGRYRSQWELYRTCKGVFGKTKTKKVPGSTLFLSIIVV